MTGLSYRTRLLLIARVSCMMCVLGQHAVKHHHAACMQHGDSKGKERPLPIEHVRNGSRIIPSWWPPALM